MAVVLLLWRRRRSRHGHEETVALSPPAGREDPVEGADLIDWTARRFMATDSVGIRAADGVHDYDERCVVTALLLAYRIPLPRSIPAYPDVDWDDDVPTGGLSVAPPGLMDVPTTADRVKNVRARAVEMSASIREGFCPSCGRGLGRAPAGSLAVPCRCLPLCVMCRRVEEYRAARLLTDAWASAEVDEEDERILQQLNLMDSIDAMLALNDGDDVGQV